MIYFVKQSALKTLNSIKMVHTTHPTSGNKRLALLIGIATALLCLPLIAMQFTSEVDWSAFDFSVMGILLFSTALLCELVLRKVKSRQQRLLLCGAILLVLVLIWAELAVGIFDSRFAGS